MMGEPVMGLLMLMGLLIPASLMVDLDFDFFKSFELFFLTSFCCAGGSGGRSGVLWTIVARW